MMNFKRNPGNKSHFSSIFSFLLIVLSTVITSCEDDNFTSTYPDTGLYNNEIVITNIVNIPENISFNKVKVEIEGVDWEVIDVIESVYENETIVLSLPASFPGEKLQRVVRENRNDYGAHWFAATDNPQARVATLKDIFLYNDDERIGRVYLTDWDGEGTILNKSWIYYQYTDQLFTLTEHTVNDEINPGSYRFNAVFEAGWNAYSNTNLTEGGGVFSILCTAPITEYAVYKWRFESYIY